MKTVKELIELLSNYEGATLVAFYNQNTEDADLLHGVIGLCAEKEHPYVKGDTVHRLYDLPKDTKVLVLTS